MRVYLRLISYIKAYIFPIGQGSLNSMNSCCRHSFPFNLSRIKFLLLIESVFFFYLTSSVSSFPYLFYRLMRPLSKVETRRGGSLPFLDFVIFLLLCLRYFPLPLFNFDFLNVLCLLLLLLCSYFCNNFIYIYIYIKPQ